MDDRFRISWDDREVDNLRKNGSCWKADSKGKFWGFINPVTKAVERDYSHKEA